MKTFSKLAFRHPRRLVRVVAIFIFIALSIHKLSEGLTNHNQHPQKGLQRKDADFKDTFSDSDIDFGNHNDRYAGVPLTKNDANAGVPLMKNNDNIGVPLMKNDDNVGVPIKENDANIGVPLIENDANAGVPLKESDVDVKSRSRCLDVYRSFRYQDTFCLVSQLIGSFTSANRVFASLSQ